jgi:uncharacterized protein YyaL (SSP411 family)
VSEEGNFEGSNIPHRTIGIVDAARMFRVAEPEMTQMIATARAKLFAARANRVHPARDDKILAAWNGMMISAFAEGYRALGDPRYLAAARGAADFVMTRLWDGHALRRSYKDGIARFNAYLEDYALMASAMIDTYEASLDLRYIEHAKVLADVILERFEDRERGGFFFTSSDHETLITRSKAAFDGSTASGNSAAVMALLRLYPYSADERYLKAADLALCLYGPTMEKQPFAFSHMIEAADLYERGPTEIALIADPADPERARWLEKIGRIHLPNLALYAIDPARTDDSLMPEALRGKRQIAGKLTGYLCRNRTCSAPMTNFEEFRQALVAPASPRA